jgi:hypothetical protein
LNNTIPFYFIGVKGSCDRSFMADIIYWISQNPPSAHFFLISGDKEFSIILHRLRMSNYNILLACPEVGSKMLRSAATMMWPWEALVKGADLAPKHVNQPPDDSSNSWYGRYRGPVDIQLLKSKDLAALPQNTKMPKAPRFAIMGVKKVLQFYPEGISLPNLRAELQKANIRIDRGFLGFKKFSGLLQAMSDVVKFIDPLPGDCQPAVVGVFNSSVEPSEQDFNGMDSSPSSVEDKHICETESEELSWASQPSSSESSCTQKQTLEADIPSLPSDQLSSIQKTTPDLTLHEQSLIPVMMFLWPQMSHHLMHYLETKGILRLLILLRKQNHRSTIQKLIRWLLPALLRQGRKVVLLALST